MRVLHIVALVSGTNAYGGPTTVAFNQCRALSQAGHQVILAAAGSDLGAQLPTEIDGVRTQLFPPLQALPGAGFAGLSSAGLLAWLPQALKNADVVHVHLARDLLTLPAAWLALRLGKRVVVQTHGMIDPSRNPLARPLDALLTRRVLRGAHRVLHLTPREARDVMAVAGSGVALQELHNGMPSLPTSASGRARKQVRVLFLARLQERKRPLSFVAMAQSLAPRFPDAVFTMVGPDEGQGHAVQEAIAQSGLGERLTWEGPVDAAGARAWMADSDIYVLPSVDEPYPMSVLEAMASGLPVVITDTCGLAPTVSRSDCGIVADASQSALDDAVSHLLEDPAERTRLGRNAAGTIATDFGMDAVVAKLLGAYRQ